MEERFDELRVTLCSDSDELAHFRQLVINSIMATDLGDKDMKALRNNRWEKAFAGAGTSGADNEGSPPRTADDDANGVDSVNRKATIVIEHLIQAADVAHTMQHWHVYRKWNQKLFQEMYNAYWDGRADKNPADFWYEGELGFFDFYIIPLAKKLDSCGVFGVSSDENLNYARKNRQEWQAKGRMVVAEMLEIVEDKRLMEMQQSTCDDNVDDNELSSEIMVVRLNDLLSSMGGDLLIESGDEFLLQDEEWGEEVSA